MSTNGSNHILSDIIALHGTVECNGVTICCFKKNTFFLYTVYKIVQTRCNGHDYKISILLYNLDMWMFHNGNIRDIRHFSNNLTPSYVADLEKGRISCTKRFTFYL